MIKLLNSEDVEKNRETLKKLLIVCREHGSGVILPDSYYEDKLNGLINYLKENKAYFFIVQDNDAIAGFLWACEIKRDIGNVFHLLHFAVFEEYQRKGYGKMLMEAAQLQAQNLNLTCIELNVSASNQKAIDFYEKNAFCADHITMIKKLN